MMQNCGFGIRIFIQKGIVVVSELLMFLKEKKNLLKIVNNYDTTTIGRCNENPYVKPTIRDTTNVVVS